MKRELPTLTTCTAELATGAGDTRGWCHDHNHDDQGDNHHHHDGHSA